MNNKFKTKEEALELLDQVEDFENALIHIEALNDLYYEDWAYYFDFDPTEEIDSLCIVFESFKERVTESLGLVVEDFSDTSDLTEQFLEKNGCCD